MSELYAFRSGPTYRGATPQEQYEAALSQPMSLASTFFDQAKGGVLESFGLGTAIRDIGTPEGVKPEPTGNAYTDTITAIDEAISPRNLAKRIIGTFDNDQPPMSKDAYEASEYARDGVPWDASMTEDRAASLAMAYDAKRVREFYAQKRPITSFVANLAGQATDPINYIPIAGPAVRAAAVAKAGKVAGLAATASLDAAANTAIFGLGTASQRRQFGDDVSWQATVSQIATAALIGGAFGTIAGALGSRADATSRLAIEERLSTLKATQEARIALNEGIDALVRAEDVALSPNATEAVARVADDVQVVMSAPKDESAYLSTRQMRQTYTAQYEVDGVSIASSRTTPSTVDVPAVGTWRIDDVRGLYGRDIERLNEVPIDELVLPELREGEKLDATKAGDDATYASWIKEGKEPPPIDVIRMDDGRLRVSDGHRRVLAAKASGADTVKAWVSELVETGKTDVEGRPMKTGLTFELAQQRASGKPQEVNKATPRPDPIPEGRKQAESRIAKPDDYKALAAQYRVDPETGSFAEEADITQLGIEGRLTEEDLAVLADSQMAYEDGAAYGEALRSVASCLV